MSHWVGRRTSLGVEDTSNVVHTACDEEDTIGRPSQVVNLRAHGPAHVLDTPCLLVLESLFEIGLGGLGLCGNPKEDIAIITGTGKHFSYRVSDLW